MTVPARQPTQERKSHQIWWDGDDWEGIEECTQMLNDREHLDLNPTDFIRKATRELVKRCRESAIEERRAS